MKSLQKGKLTSQNRSPRIQEGTRVRVQIPIKISCFIVRKEFFACFIVRRGFLRMFHSSQRTFQSVSLFVKHFSECFTLREVLFRVFHSS